MKSLPIAETITAWRCIGCGRLEAPANCIGVCQDRKMELVGARDYGEALVQLEKAYDRIAKLEAVVAKLAPTTPREGAWKDSYLAPQLEATRRLSPRA
jgi:hypothetical protein